MGLVHLRAGRAGACCMTLGVVGRGFVAARKDQNGRLAQRRKTLRRPRFSCPFALPLPTPGTLCTSHPLLPFFPFSLSPSTVHCGDGIAASCILSSLYTYPYLRLNTSPAHLLPVGPSPNSAPSPKLQTVTRPGCRSGNLRPSQRETHSRPPTYLLLLLLLLQSQSLHRDERRKTRACAT